MVMIPDSLLLMVCSGAGVKLILTNNMSEYQKHKVFEEPEMKGINEVAIN